ncbi:unnamed protein product [Calicophoron daubneyi]|uniref:Uncharacterized protein n=1 Tax=Calicophoron daubneyi TaxID=300641 RepID=A0AAV2TM86_CALDB
MVRNIVSSTHYTPESLRTPLSRFPGQSADVNISVDRYGSLGMSAASAPISVDGYDADIPLRTLLYCSDVEQFTSRVRTSLACYTQVEQVESRDVGVSFVSRPNQLADMGIQAVPSQNLFRPLGFVQDVRYEISQTCEGLFSIHPTSVDATCQTEILESQASSKVPEPTIVFGGERTYYASFTDSTDTTVRTTTESVLKEYPKVHSIRCRVRQRTVQYELLEARRAVTSEWPSVIKEVASPITGLFAPVGMAVRAGWLDLTDRNLYIDPTTGLAIPLEEALNKGFIRLSTDQSAYRMDEEVDRPMLLLIERITFGWCPARIVSFIDTTTNERYSIDEALRLGYIDISTGDPMILDSEAGVWISTEEAAGRNVVQLEPIDPTEEHSEIIEETFSCRVFRITYVRPGGEPSDWLEPLEAARIGLFNWQTGEVASEWRVRPVLPTFGPHMQYLSERYMPTKWCSLLTARKAGWLRLQAELHPTQWIAYIPTPDSNLGHVVLATHVHLVAPTTIPISARAFERRIHREESMRPPFRPVPPRIIYKDKRRTHTTRKHTVTHHRAQSEAHITRSIPSRSILHHGSSEIFGRQRSRRRLYFSEQTLTATHRSEFITKEFRDDLDL